MGIYFNPDNRAFTKSYKNPLYVDKSLLIQKINPFIDINDCFVCVARPRRFGKSVDANMLTAYYSKGCDSTFIFDNLKISQTNEYKDHLNKHNVIYLNMLSFYEDADNVEDMKNYIRDDVVDELKEEYDVCANRNTLPAILRKIYKDTKTTFIFIIDEWDCVLRDDKFNDQERKTYLRFLNSIFKDSIYISLVYMTGILPIKKYGTQSSLSMFKEITMINPTPFEVYMGFTENEVKKLCDEHHMDFDEMKSWYDGYHFGELSLYNPRSIVFSINDRKYDNYWTNTETYESLKIYFDENMDGIKEDIISLLAGECIIIDPLSFENDMTVYNSKDDIFTLLVHLGYLGYNSKTSEVYIPNREVRAQFEIALRDSHWKELDKAIQNSMELLNATWAMDEEKVAYYIEEAHLGISNLKYNSEEALAHTVDIAYFAARGYYKKFIELQTGNGFCDIVYIPKTDKPALLVELKWQDSPTTAINQIKEKKYYKGLEEYSHNLLLVGISYQKDINKHNYKEHYCKIEKYVP